MDSSNPRSISGSHSIPFNSKDSADAYFQDMTAFTPPTHNWLSNRNLKKEIQSSSGIKKTSEHKKFFVPEANQLEDPCKKYIESSEISVKSNKSLGTDDHFKSAACSKNLLKVCEKLLTTKEFSASPASSSSIDNFPESEDDFDAELSLMNEKSRMEFYRSKYGNRRNSQSLPASPKMDRKNQSAQVSHNPYFTITKTTSDSKPTLSFLTSLFGITAAKPSDAQANMTQKYEVDSALSSQKMNDITSAAFGGSDPQQQTSSSRYMTPKPHHYREMNIFSPTSM